MGDMVRYLPTLFRLITMDDMVRDLWTLFRAITLADEGICSSACVISFIYMSCQMQCLVILNFIYCSRNGHTSSTNDMFLCIYDLLCRGFQNSHWVG